jgi:uncharacterized peroxidase-related enzyme
VLDNWRTAPISQPLRATLAFLEKLTLDPLAVTTADVEPLRAIGLSDDAIGDAVHVCALFNMYDRIADSLGFAVPGPEAFEQTATRLLQRGYQ